MKKLKLTDWFSSIADKVSATDGSPVLSITALTGSLKEIMGDTAPVPAPCYIGDYNQGHGRWFMGAKAIEDYLNQFFC